MKVVTGEQMAEIDRLSSEAGVPTLELMERAGEAIVTKAAEMVSGLMGTRLAIICGKGNNGGDGLVAARLLKKYSTQVTVLLVGRAEELTGAPKTNFVRAVEAGIQIEEGADGASVQRACEAAHLVIDALLGTGIRGPVRGAAAEAIHAMNLAGRPILAVDVPSGVDADTGEVATEAVRADHTITLGLAKWGLLNYPGAEYAGELTIADIGLPAAAVEAVASNMECLDREEVAALLPRRAPTAHKGEAGNVLVVAGSVGYTGAAALCSMAALRTGAGLVTLAIPKSLNDIMEMKLTEVITRPMPETPARTLAIAAVPAILELANNNDVVVIGPGLSLDPETVLLVRELVGKLQKPMVLDADALTALAEDTSVLEKTLAPVVCTPHPGEMSRLIGLPTAKVQKARAGLCRRLAHSLGVVVVLKGAATLISDPLERLRVNRTGNAGMASAGTGDVLSGMIGGLIAQGMTPFDAAGAGAYLHGLAGDLAAEEKGLLGLIASDVLEKIPAAILKVTERVELA